MDADVSDDEEQPGLMLQQAAIYNNTEFLESLLQGQEKQWVDLQDSYGRTALYTCVTNNSLQCGHMLLQAGGSFLGTIHQLGIQIEDINSRCWSGLHCCMYDARITHWQMITCMRTGCTTLLIIQCHN